MTFSGGKFTGNILYQSDPRSRHDTLLNAVRINTKIIKPRSLPTRSLRSYWETRLANRRYTNQFPAQNMMERERNTMEIRVHLRNSQEKESSGSVGFMVQTIEGSRKRSNIGNPHLTALGSGSVQAVCSLTQAHPLVPVECAQKGRVQPLVVMLLGAGEQGEWGDTGQRVQTSSYKMSEF